MQKITRQSSLLEVIQNYPETYEVFMKYGIGCVGCMLAAFETVEQGAMAHGIDPDALVNDLNKVIEKYYSNQEESENATENKEDGDNK